jgi:hypothetical protein
MARPARRNLLLTGIGEGLGVDIATTFAGAGNGCNVFGLSRTGRMDLKSIARAYLGLAAQDCSAWT